MKLSRYKVLFSCLLTAAGISFALSVSMATAAERSIPLVNGTELTAQRIYDWARMRNSNALYHVRKYIDVKDSEDNTALCLAQKAEDMYSYELLTYMGASHKEKCHKKDSINVIVGERIEVAPAGMWALGAAGVAGAVIGGKVLYDEVLHNKKCPSGYTVALQSVEDCGSTGESGWIFDTHRTDENGKRCGRCTPKQCSNDYLPLYQSATDCGVSGSEGWTYEKDGFSGDLNCGRCIKKECVSDDNITVRGSSTYQFTPELCPVRQYMQAESVSQFGWSGDDACYNCNYICDEAEGFAETTDCINNKSRGEGYGCATDMNTNCFYRTNLIACPLIDTPESKGTDINSVDINHCPKRDYMVVEKVTQHSWSGEDGCFSCDYICDEETGFKNESDCELNKAGGKAYSCSIDEGTNCYIKREPLQCIVIDTVESKGTNVRYTDTEHCPPRDYMVPNTVTQHGWSGEHGCFACDYICDEETGFKDESDCEKNAAGGKAYSCSIDAPTGCYVKREALTCVVVDTVESKGTNQRYTDIEHCPPRDYMVPNTVTQHGWSGEYGCFACDYICDEETGFKNESDCEKNAVGEKAYSCSLDAPSGCYLKREPLTCVAADTTQTRGSDTTYANDALCPSRDYMELVNTTQLGWSGEDGCFVCHYQCDEETGFANESNCEKNASGEKGYSCELDEASQCYHQVAVLTCSDLGTTNPKIRGYDTDFADIRHCVDTRTYLTADKVTQSGWSGEDGCYACHYICNETDGFAQREDCIKNALDGTGYTCDLDSATYCYYRVAEEICEDKGTTNPKVRGSSRRYTETQYCPARPYLVAERVEQNGYQAEIACYDCYYRCDEETGFEEQSTCELNAAGVKAYNCVKDSFSGCWNRNKNKDTEDPEGPGEDAGDDEEFDVLPCADGDVRFQSELDCTIYLGGTNSSWSYDFVGYSGEQKCGKCSALPCPAESGTKVEYQDYTQCPTSTESNLLRSQPSVGLYSGSDVCYECIYECIESKEAYDTKERCLEVNPTWLCNKTSGGCFKKGDPKPCETPYAQTSYTSSASCGVKAGAGWNWTQYPSDKSGDDICATCEAKECVSPYTTQVQDVANCGNGSAGSKGWQLNTHSTYNGDTPCTQCTKLTCPGTQPSTDSAAACTNTNYATSERVEYPDKFNGDDQCYQCVYTCNSSASGSSYSHSVKTTCQAEAKKTGWDCDQDSTSGCYYVSTKNSINCTTSGAKTDYSDKSKCPTDNIATVSSSHTTSAGDWSAGKACYLCDYTCNPDNTTIFNNESTCKGMNGSKQAYDCTQSTYDSTCWKRTGAHKCATGTSKDYADNSNCSAITGVNKDTSYATGDYEGEDQCYKCTYSCNYTTEATCRKSGHASAGTGSDGYGYNCTSVSVTNKSNGTSTCWYQTGNKSCTAGSINYNTSSGCPKGNTPDAYISSINVAPNGYYSGDSQCFTCTYNCVYTSSADCTSGGWKCSQDGTTKCWYRTGEEACATGYNTSVNAASCTSGTCYNSTFQENGKSGDKVCGRCYNTCNTNESNCFSAAGSDTADGWTYTQTGGIACYVKSATPCKSDSYNTTIQSVDDCGTPTAVAAGGWEFVDGGKSGGVTCGGCMVNPCPQGQGKNCTGGESGRYEGNEKCQYCADGDPSGSEDPSTLVFDWEQKNNQTLINYNEDGDYAGNFLVNAGANSSTVDGKAIGELLVYNKASDATVAVQSGNGISPIMNAKATGTDAEGKISAKGRLVLSMEKGAENVTGYGMYSRNDAINANATDNAMAEGSIYIEDLNASSNEVYGMYAEKNAYNARINGEGAEAKGEVFVHTITDKAAYGMYAKGDVYNQSGNGAESSVKVIGYGDGNMYGLYSENGNIYNSGDVKVQAGGGDAYGIYLENGDGKVIDNSGNIMVSSAEKEAYGIYVEDAGNGMTITNSGLIDASGSDNSRGIKVAGNGQNARVENTGRIIVNGALNAEDSAIDLGGAVLANRGEVIFNSAQDLNAMNGRIVLEKGGTFEAFSLSGDLSIGTSVVNEGFKDTYTEKNAIKSENVDGLNISSESALFEAYLETNDEGGQDAVAERRGFDEFSPNGSIGRYLEDNYKNHKLAELFRTLIEEKTDVDLRNTILNKTGANFLINLPQENLSALRNASETISDSVLEDTDDVYRVTSGADGFYQKSNGRKGASGYENTSATAFMYGDKRLDNNNRLGLGLSFMQMRSNYDNGTDRTENFANVFVPWLHKFNDRMRMVSVFTAGYGYGEYDRGRSNEADINDFIYGVTNKLVYNVNLADVAELEPALILNIMGYYSGDMKDDELVVQAGNHLSVEGGAGLFLKRKLAEGKYGKLTGKVGGIYYHEFAEPYQNIRAGFRGGMGSYTIDDYAGLYSRDRAVLAAMLDYEYKNIAVYLKYYHLLQANQVKNWDFGIKYNF